MKKKVVSRKPCRLCHDLDKEVYGCPFVGFAGKGATPSNSRNIKRKEITKTCAEWYATRPAIVHIYDELEDYRRGSLGRVGCLALPYVSLLRILDRELTASTNEIESKLLSED